MAISRVFSRSPERVYGLTFVSAGKFPQIACVVEARHAPHLDELIRSFAKRLLKPGCDMHKYLGGYTHFYWGEGKSFGFDRCGERVMGDGEICYGVRLRNHQEATNAAATLSVILQCCSAAVGLLQPAEGPEFIPNRHQLLDAYSSVDKGGHLHSHPVHGFVYPSLGRWLAERGRKFPRNPSALTPEAYRGFSLPLEIVQVMQRVWRITAPPSVKQYKRDCYAGITHEGRFSFRCFGDACDVSMYPDQMLSADWRVPAAFACHNLDSAHQQLTLIAGLAALHDLAVKDLG